MDLISDKKQDLLFFRLELLVQSVNIVFVTQSIIKVCTKVFKQVKKKLIKNLGYKYNLQYNIH